MHNKSRRTQATRKAKRDSGTRRYKSYSHHLEKKIKITPSKTAHTIVLTILYETNKTFSNVALLL